ncbi:MAG: hypothetical protein ACKOYJ_00715 [Planctomycetia bacterium]
MTLLVDFLCRFGWGLAAGLVLTPVRLVPSGFFRINMLVVMGLATFAALLAGTTMPAAVAGLTGAAAVIAWLGSVAWLARRDRPGMLACASCGLLLAAATIVMTTAGTASPAIGRSAGAILSGLVVGLSVHAMLLGHWYLNAPGIRIDALTRMIDLAMLAWGAQLLVTLSSAGGAAAQLAAADRATLAIVSLRWLAGLVGLPVLLWMSRRTLDIPNTQSATGILYVACLAAITGELAAQLIGSIATGS